MPVYNKHHHNAPADAIYVGRGSVWGNPFYIGEDGTREEVVAKYDEYLRNDKVLMAMVHTLAGKDLVCFCAPELCHGHVLERVAQEQHEAWQAERNRMAEILGDNPYYIAFTGHRPDKIGGYNEMSPQREAVKKAIRDALIRAKNKFPDRQIVGIVGGALGVDTDAARECYKLGIPYILYIPFEGMESRWPVHAQNRFSVMRSLAAKVIITADPGYHPRKMQIRNERMVNDCDALIAVWDGSDGGTANCVRYAMRIDKPMVRIRLQDLGV